ncbi:5-methyltetrahydropteroyltriglutamate--homocysteine methyltransferase [Saccharopolyspora kobensis]|uniref:5-methyltetrahydropteroyltriglutamate--homocysteine methyltransferase n=1 Tax=Saccharopolyspora kobensis TaxID=146035 RepID=A0A1H6DYT5_9PSEU|nr:5-methyltetrahydropteroyltriglutamate--homocysteine S-methyltransferase [Saccharopolyspora kobensis]SEG90321.1 5-methyltetrahydropteroyltriglutamate--homocysteine methyltransferase [Saccharopolyspora kobensis]SFD90554.1 5-methyltetrahydropteroyltriglutamate--homocysteine methyltransferase [Saccharopolyspora kobensis]
MSPRVSPPFRADHVGSLLRPQSLLDARDDHAAGRIDDAELRRVEDEAITQVVAMQEEVGLHSATDGEFRRSSWHMDFLYQLDGVERVDDASLKVQFRNERGDVEFATPDLRVTGRIGLSRTIFAEAFTALAERVTTATPKLTIPSPGMLYYRGGRAAIDEATYPDLAEFRSDLAAAYRTEVRALADLGCHYLQLDDTSLAYLNDPAQRAQLTARGDDAERAHLQTIQLINESLRGRPDTLAVTTHMCRGNFRSSWVAEGGYDFVAEALFNELDVDGFFLEFDDERSGGFEPLRFVPKGKAVVLGLVTTKRGELESKDALKRRIEQAARYVDIDQLCLSPQCGFASTKDGNSLTCEEEVAKLRLVVETAAEVWG